MIESLPLFHRIADRPVVVTGSGEAAEAKRRLVERAGGQVVRDLAQGIERGARIAFIAEEDEAIARAAVRQAQAAGLLVNAPDRPLLCDFTVPSILDRTPVLVAIGTGGASAGLAKQLRLRLEALLPQSLGVLARSLLTARPALRARFPDPGQRRQALDAALGQGGALDPLAEGGPNRVAEWLADAAEPEGGRVEIVLRSADPEDLTLREARLLGSADMLLHGADVPAAILDRARADAARGPIGAQTQAAGGLIVVLRMG